MKLRHLLAATIAAACALLPAAHAQQDFPNRPVRIFTPFPPGAGPEVMLRSVAQKLQKAWGQPVVIENRPGANGFIAIDAFRQGVKDGHDLVQLDGLHVAGYQSLFKRLPYDPVRDFEPVTPLLRATFFVVVSTNSKFRSAGDIVAAAKAQPGKLNYGSWSVGNPVHLGVSDLMGQSGTDMTHVAYKDANIMYAAVATNELDFSLGTLQAVRAFSGRIKPIAVAAPARHPAAPDVPTIAEAGGPPVTAAGWSLLAAPKGVPPAVADKIKRDVDAALAEADTRAFFATAGYDAFPLTREQLAAFIGAESAKIATVVRTTKISMD